MKHLLHTTDRDSNPLYKGELRPISDELGVPVVDGVTAATLTVQSLVVMGLGTSKRGEFATPPPKEYTSG